LEWNDEDVTTVGGYVVRRLGHLPRVGEQLRIDGYIVTVEQADVRRVQQLSFRHGSQVCCHDAAGVEKEDISCIHSKLCGLATSGTAMAANRTFKSGSFALSSSSCSGVSSAEHCSTYSEIDSAPFLAERRRLGIRRRNSNEQLVDLITV